MSRVMSTLLLLAGATLLVTWLVTPAVSAPPAQAAVPHSVLDDAMPLLADVNAQVLELHDRVAGALVYPPPVRDPFTYAARPRSVRAVAPPPAPEIVPPAVEVRVLPALVAILSADATSPRRAVLSMPDADDVQFVASGGTSGSFVVRESQDDVVVLADGGDTTLRLTLR